ncbi:DNA/RNA-binding protein KIN17 [Sphaerodactylus townsendi]|uniref:DNA/RNA-binding protein KIN17 n=1 Tax=Sphaerodactylus townsendi TaxID=933632 RepID=UPI002025D6DB|nr:DNA/RNA-binding protein KIN17 [Sphaerodactylus townsendi]
MGKTDFLSPKAIANRIKSKGLQKLRWYCQMCQKQCRDENGFKCHCMSESHQRQLLLASENPQQFMDHFSEEFRNDFLELLRRRFGTKRVHNNIVYNEYISHREHIHMNATQWETLTDFTKWLGREGFCKVDETPKGWYIQYIDRDPETIRRQQEQEKKKKQDLDDEEKSARFIEEQVKRGLEGKDQETPVYTELNRENDEEKVVFNLNKGASTSAAAHPQPSLFGPSGLKTVGAAPTVKRKETSILGQPKEKKRKTALDEIIELEEEKKKSARTDYWLQPVSVVVISTDSATGFSPKASSCCNKRGHLFMTALEESESLIIHKAKSALDGFSRPESDPAAVERRSHQRSPQPVLLHLSILEGFSNHGEFLTGQPAPCFSQGNLLHVRIPLQSKTLPTGITAS